MGNWVWFLVAILSSYSARTESGGVTCMCKVSNRQGSCWLFAVSECSFLFRMWFSEAELNPSLPGTSSNLVPFMPLRMQKCLCIIKRTFLFVRVNTEMSSFILAGRCSVGAVMPWDIATFRIAWTAWPSAYGFVSSCRCSQIAMLMCLMISLFIASLARLLDLHWSWCFWIMSLLLPPHPFLNFSLVWQIALAVCLRRAQAFAA